MSYVHTEIQNDAFYITLDYPEKKNGLDAELGTSLLDAIRAGNNETSVHSIILQSKHRAYFSSGPRLEDLLICARDQSDVRLRDVLHVLNHCVLEIFTSPKVTIALINGYAYGGGFNMMLVCDRRIALKRAKFLENFHKMGISPDLGASYLLPRIIGYEQTINLLLEGKVFTSEEALQLGLIQEVCENKHELQERLQNYLKAVSEGYVPAIAATKKLLKGKAAEELKQQLEQETEELVALFKQTEIKKRLEALV